MVSHKELFQMFIDAVQEAFRACYGTETACTGTVTGDNNASRDIIEAAIEFLGYAQGITALSVPMKTSDSVNLLITQKTAPALLEQILSLAKSHLEDTPFNFFVQIPCDIEDRHILPNRKLPYTRFTFSAGGQDFSFFLCMRSGDGDVAGSGESTSSERPTDSSVNGELTFGPSMEKVVNAFVIETTEYLDQLEQDLVQLSSAPGQKETTNAVFRAFHTIKGNALSLGFENMHKLVHAAEDIIRKVTDGKTALRPEVIDVLLKSVDTLKVLLQEIRDRRLSRTNVSGIIGELAMALQEKQSATGTVSSGKDPGTPRMKSAAPSTIRIETVKVDKIINTAGELVLSKNRLLNLVQQIEQGTPEIDIEEQLDEIITPMSIMVSELQQNVMSTRMQPVEKAFNRFGRIVYDLSRELGKEIDLTVTGEKTELDNSIIEQIGDPLIHLVRNSCDHGIETPAVRQSRNKPSKGTIELKAGREGNFVIIEIRDDGQGLDPEFIRTKALEKGLISREQARTMPDSEAVQLIFETGFSTAESVSAISGRGIGMDVVKSTVSKLNGIIEMHSEKGKGTSVRMRLPLTLAMAAGLEVEAGGERYLIPQEAIIENIQLSPARLRQVMEQKKFVNGNRYSCPVVDLREALEITPDPEHTSESAYIVVIGKAQKRAGILVDNIYQQHEIMLKPPGRYIGNFAPAGIDGAVVMGDGTIEFVLNADYLILTGDAVLDGVCP